MQNAEREDETQRIRGEIPPLSRRAGIGRDDSARGVKGGSAFAKASAFAEATADETADKG